MRLVDLGSKLTGDDSVLPHEVAAVMPGAMTELAGADPQERMCGIWAFRVAP